ncbi:MAG: GNAT family N-acetyltransferase [Candidatus Bathyarchaeia archaeon]
MRTQVYQIEIIISNDELTGEMQVTQLLSASDINFVFPVGFSFFEPYLAYHTKEILEIGGEAYVTRTPDGVTSGLFIYDGSEKSGTIYTRSREIFDYFYELKPFNWLFSEMQTELESEIYDIYTVDLENLALVHRFSYEISMAEKGQTGEIERFMASTHPGINKRWVSVALENGERCFTVRLSGEIAGLGWVSLVNGVGRLHSLYVKPQLRRIGVGEDILNARLLWLKSKHARSAFCEISRYNVASSGNVTKAHMRVSGQVFQYFRKNLDRKREMKS